MNFQLIATNGLVQIADRIRKDTDFKPMHAMDEYSDEACDSFGWYDFYIGLNGYMPTHIDTEISFVVVESDSEDNEQRYSIDLTTDEQIAIYNRLNEQCLKYEGKSCEDMLSEARSYMARRYMEAQS